ncbi:MAG: hypothetical protein JNK75_13005 [Betaproteobacteria bacterium]|nr:hypothetical protein [Betaproteobacteria bacterium]
MSEHDPDDQRRALLQSAAGLLLAQAALPAGATPAAPERKGVGQPGDFDFLNGHWKIRHRRYKTDVKQWDTFEGEASCWSILKGIASIEELRIPARDFSGTGIRLLDVKNRLWHDYWVNGKSGVLTPPGQTGVFDNGVGTFGAEDTDDGKPIKVRGVWDRITPTSCRWFQGVSKDGGKTWDDNWFMDWTRA